jgi:hypothetical protein
LWRGFSAGRVLFSRLVLSRGGILGFGTFRGDIKGVVLRNTVAIVRVVVGRRKGVRQIASIGFGHLIGLWILFSLGFGILFR